MTCWYDPEPGRSRTVQPSHQFTASPPHRLTASPPRRLAVPPLRALQLLDGSEDQLPLALPLHVASSGASTCAPHPHWRVPPSRVLSAASGCPGRDKSQMRQVLVAVAMAVAVWIGVASDAVAQAQSERRV